MTLRGKFIFWIAAIVLAAVFIVPIALKSPFIDELVEQYSEAVEAAQEDDDDDDEDGEESELVERMQVRVNDEISDYVGIEAHLLETTQFFPEIKAQARGSRYSVYVDITDEIQSSKSGFQCCKSS